LEGITTENTEGAYREHGALFSKSSLILFYLKGQIGKEPAMNVLNDKDRELVDFCKSRKKQWLHGSWVAIVAGIVLVVEFALFVAFDAKWRKLLAASTNVVVNGVPKLSNPYKLIIILVFALMALLISLGISQLNHVRRTNKLIGIIDKLQVETDHIKRQTSFGLY
jgi:amino acid transporter